MFGAKDRSVGMGERKSGTGEEGWNVLDVGLGRGKEFVGRERGKETRGVAEWGEAAG